MLAEGSPDPRRPRIVRSLSFHSTYRCRNTGVCCSSGWEIAVEDEVQIRLTSLFAIDSKGLPNGPNGFRLMADPPAGCRSSLRTTQPQRACWFRDEEARACAIHRAYGEAALPSACRQFPRVCVLEPDGVSVSLSHYCPTAAALLFDEPAPFRLVEFPRAFPADWPFEGLDARGAYPPFLRPGVLLGFDGLRALEEQAVAVLSRGPLWCALNTIDAAIERARGWSADAGPLAELLPGYFNPGGASDPRVADPRPVLLGSMTEGTDPGRGLPEYRPAALTLSPEVDAALRRYLASRLIASWIAFLGNDLRSLARYLRLCLDTVFLFEAARATPETEAARWKEAIRDADLWILHHCDPDLIARNLR